jgi:hypothetical protein
LRRYKLGVCFINCALVVAMWIGACYILRDHAAWDFPGFWVAGRIAPEHLYQPEVFQPYGRGLLKDQGVVYVNVYSRPAIFTLPLRVWMQMPYRMAYGTWAAVQAVALLLLLALVWRVYEPDPRLLPILLLLWPAVYGVMAGHDVAMLGILMLVGVIALKRDHEWLAGIVWGLCLYKFNLALCLPILLAWHRRWKALGAFSATAAVLAAGSALIASPSDYIKMLGRLNEVSMDTKILSLRTLSYPMEIGSLYPVLALTVCGVTLWRITKTDIARGLALGVLASLLSGYHVGDYDYTLSWLSLGLLLADGNWMARAVAILGAGWLGWQLMAPAAIIPLFVVVWIFAVHASARPRQAVGPPPAYLGEPDGFSAQLPEVGVQ